MSLLQTITATTPSSATTAVLDGRFNGLGRFESLFIDADLQGATGGALDIYLQRKVDTDKWADWVSFPQQSAGGAATSYAISVSRNASTIVVVGGGTDDTPAPVLAADSIAGGIPTTEVRVVAVAGASTSAGAEITIRVRGTERAL